jgi:hypothetical protein
MTRQSFSTHTLLQLHKTDGFMHTYTSHLLSSSSSLALPDFTSLFSILYSAASAAACSSLSSSLSDKSSASEYASSSTELGLSIGAAFLRPSPSARGLVRWCTCEGTSDMIQPTRITDASNKRAQIIANMNSLSCFVYVCSRRLHILIL